MTQRITSRRNPLLQHVKKLLSSRSYRRTCGEYAAEGTKLLEECAKWDAGLKTVIAQDGVALCALPQTVQVVRVPEDVMQSVSQMDAPQGVVFVCDLPKPCEAALQAGSILLDGIQDPGNLGTILRTADALEIPVVLCEGCADAYSPKTVRASMGAVFRTPPQSKPRQAVIKECRARGIPLYVTAMSDDAKDLRTAQLCDAMAVSGSEGQGVCPELMDAADGKLIIPMSPRCESLNAAVAATIVMWQMKR